MLRWKRDTKPTGLARIGAPPAGSTLFDGEVRFAVTMASSVRAGAPANRWYWVAGWRSPVPHHNTADAPCATEAEAKLQAMAYVRANLLGATAPDVAAKPEAPSAPAPEGEYSGELIFDAPPPILCKHCGKAPGNHLRDTKACPIGRGSFPSFSKTDTYEPRKQHAKQPAKAAPVVDAADTAELLSPAAPQRPEVFRTEPSVSKSDAAKLEWAILTLRAVADLGRDKPLGDLYADTLMVIGALKRVLEPNIVNVLNPVEPAPAAEPLPEDTSRKLLFNLAIRLRMARRRLSRAKRDNYAPEILQHIEGAQLEAWNSFQAAKAIGYRQG